MARLKISDDAMLALRKKGLSNKEIARKLGIGYQTVYNHIGAPPVEMSGWKKVSDEDILAGHELGMSSRQIAAEYGCDVSTIHKRLKKLLAEAAPSSTPEPKPEQLQFVQQEEKPVEPVSCAPKEPEQPKPAPIPVQATPVQPARTVKNQTTVETELFKFAYVPSVCEQMNMLSLLADPEPWSFADPAENKASNPETTILELYINETFKERATEYNACAPEERDNIILTRDKFCCFHTGLYTSDFQSIFAYFGPNRNPSGIAPWYFVGFQTESSPALQGINPLPRAHRRTLPPFDTSLKLRINTAHILKNPKTAERLPPFLRDYWNPSLLLETAIEYGCRKTLIDPLSIVSCPRINQPCYLMPLYITQPDKPDIVAVIEPMDGYNHVRTCLTPKQAYLYARLHARPAVEWLRALVTPKERE